jgi:hypothetical protein
MITKYQNNGVDLPYKLLPVVSMHAGTTDNQRGEVAGAGAMQE